MILIHASWRLTTSKWFPSVIFLSTSWFCYTHSPCPHQSENISLLLPAPILSHTLSPMTPPPNICFKILLHQLFWIFRFSFSIGIVPLVWKHASKLVRSDVLIPLRAGHLAYLLWTAIVLSKRPNLNSFDKTILILLILSTIKFSTSKFVFPSLWLVLLQSIPKF